MFLLGCTVLAQAALGSFIILTPPASQRTLHDSAGYGPARGDIITATSDFNILSLGLELSLLRSATTGLTAEIYLSTGLGSTGRGRLLATATTTIQDGGSGASQFYDVPISFTVSSGQNYDISIKFPNFVAGRGDSKINTLPTYDFDPSFFHRPPFNVGGLVTVRDGELSGCGVCNVLTPNLRLNVGDEVPEPASGLLFIPGILAVIMTARYKGILFGKGSSLRLD
jgi:hypothetical protein